MNILKLVLKNITRKKARSFLTLLGITVGIASLVSFLSLGSGLKDEIKKQAADLGANLIITPKGWCAYEQVSVLTGEQLPEAIPLDDVRKISAIKGLTAVPYLTERTAIDNSPVPVIGILPSQMKVFKGWVTDKGDFLESDEKSIIIGYGIAQQFKLNPKDELTIRGERFPIKGILKETGSKDDIAMFMPLSVAQRLYGVGDMVSFIAVKVDDIAKTDEYILKIQETSNVAVVSDKQLLKSVLSIVGTVNATLQLTCIVTILTAAFGVINTMMTAVSERRREIGILQAIGARQVTIFKIFLVESGFYGIVGGIVGVTIGLVFSSIAAAYISRNEFTAFLKSPDVAKGFEFNLVMGALFFSLLVSLMSGLYPAWKASKLSPVEAISYE
ncbi:ABC transporter permease [Candidatus Magnetominusculus xianensis]|uniref:ABC transporter permease n=1 Tax=Candidatus Magnetominusculus xianensis TaxID=1748249 RepID=A0ABR5SD62_9BACT|nr:ABC transporter permease [Candidatus Magnetominusculus xianensis]KWT76406.1 ABC transporter permease [Candidatus Magnetominusculus xianensis]MBF0404874.1 ABC transporter permease [Nitrospirota bacterium]